MSTQSPSKHHVGIKLWDHIGRECATAVSSSLAARPCSMQSHRSQSAAACCPTQLSPRLPHAAAGKVARGGSPADGKGAGAVGDLPLAPQQLRAHRVLDAQRRELLNLWSERVALSGVRIGGLSSKGARTALPAAGGSQHPAARAPQFVDRELFGRNFRCQHDALRTPAARCGRLRRSQRPVNP